MTNATFKQGDTVYLTDGREAEYVMENNGIHLVHVMRHVEASYDEPDYSYPDEKITTAQRVFASAPVDVVDAEFSKREAELLSLRGDLAALRSEIAEAGRAKAEIERAAAKYPSIQQALDFIEGRITHVVSISYFDVSILTIKDALEDCDLWHGRARFDGMKLLCLFGTDTEGKTRWQVNQYRDGSGSGWTTILPAKSEEEAREIVRQLLDEAATAWRDGQKLHHPGIDTIIKGKDWLEAPADWIAHLEQVESDRRAQKIEELRSEIAKLEVGLPAASTEEDIL